MYGMWVRAVLSWLQKSTSSSGSPVSSMISLVMLSLVMTLPAHRPQVQGARAQRLHRKPVHGWLRCPSGTDLDRVGRTAIPGPQLMLLLCMSAASGKHEQMMCLVASSLQHVGQDPKTPAHPCCAPASVKHEACPRIEPGDKQHYSMSSGRVLACAQAAGQEQQTSGRAQEAP